VTDLQALAGYTVAVTAARRREEFAALLTRRGARVVLAPTIRIVPLSDDTELRVATDDILAAPVDIVVGTTGVGFRGWLEAADVWGVGEALRAHLAGAEIVARGPKVRGAIRAAGLKDAWAPESELMGEVLDRLLARNLDGTRIVVQLHGDPLREAVDALRAAGAHVMTVPVYRWTLPADVGPAERLIEQIVSGELDAVTFTSAPAVAGLLEVADRAGRLDAVLDAMRGGVLPMAIGPVCAAPLERAGVPTLQPDRARLANLARLVVDEVPRRCGLTVTVRRRRVELRGHAVVVDTTFIDLPPVPRALLRELAAAPGHVRSRDELACVLPGFSSGTHAVDAAVAQLRALLGDATLVQTVVKRGYRLAVDA
jgi:uroporphyrinogen-III synthase